jgi:hypothetical protein
MSKFIIRETAINTDGTNIWFYPQVLIKRKETKADWFWKLIGKKITTEEYHNFYDKGDYIAILSKKEADELSYNEKQKIIGFRAKEEAEHWLIEHISKIRKENAQKNEKLYKYLGGVSDKDTKSHDVKID